MSNTNTNTESTNTTGTPTRPTEDSLFGKAMKHKWRILGGAVALAATAAAVVYAPKVLGALAAKGGEAATEAAGEAASGLFK